MVPKSVTLSDLERPNGRHYALFQTVWQLSEPTGSNLLKPDLGWPATSCVFSFCVFDVCVFALFQCVWLLVVLAAFIIIIITFLFVYFYFILFYFTVLLVCILCVLWHMDPCGLNQINK